MAQETWSTYDPVAPTSVFAQWEPGVYSVMALELDWSNEVCDITGYVPAQTYSWPTTQLGMVARDFVVVDGSGMSFRPRRHPASTIP